MVILSASGAGKLIDLLPDKALWASFTKHEDQVLIASQDRKISHWGVAQFKKFGDLIAHSRRVVPDDLSTKKEDLILPAK